MNTKEKAYQIVQQLERNFRDLMTLWSDNSRGDVDQMLEANYPFNLDISDQWADVQMWMDGMDVTPQPEPKKTVSKAVAEGLLIEVIAACGEAVNDATLDKEKKGFAAMIECLNRVKTYIGEN